MAKSSHVALFIETSLGYGRDLLKGVIQYLREHDPWVLYFQPHGLESRPPDWLKDWRGDGILVRVEDRAMAEAVRGTGLPAVNLRVPMPDIPLPLVGLDSQAVAEVAYGQFRQRGFRHFAFCGIPAGRYVWMDERRIAFEKAVLAAGRECHTFAPTIKRKGRLSWEEDRGELAAWIGGLPKPIGLMAGTDDRGIEVLEACRRAGVTVPDEVAVIGVGNDEIICNLCNPPLSSISPNAQRIGYTAAALLDRLMAGESPPVEPVLLPPGNFEARQSTDVLATDDRELAAAIRSIRDNACDGLRLKDFFKTCRISRRELERRMRQLLGRSPKEEIMRVQLDRAKQLLSETDLSVAEIAGKCGFSQAKYFSQLFHEKIGKTPGAFRKDAASPGC